jgi:hypothetical protein
MKIPSIHPVVSAVVVLSLTSGCGLLGIGGGGGGLLGGIGGPKVPPVYGPYSVGDVVKIGLGEREMRIQTSIEVPPDHGTSGCSIRGHGGNFDGAAAQMTKAFADLKKIGAGAGCGFKITGYVVPNSSDNLKWKTGGSAEVFADVGGKDADARITGANGCFKALREYLLGQAKYDTATESGFEVKCSDESWSVEKDLDKHRDTLVKQADDRLKAVEKASSKMWDHADVQCTSAGMVTVSSSNSHSVLLQLEMLCPVSPAETNAGHQVGK